MYQRLFPFIGLTLLSACQTLPADRPWSMQASATAGVALVYHAGEADEVRVACRRNPEDFLIAPQGFAAAAGNPPLHIVGESAEAKLETTPIPGASKAVEGIGKIAEVLPVIESSTAFQLRYANQRRVLPGVEGGLRAAFAKACHQGG